MDRRTAADLDRYLTTPPDEDDGAEQEWTARHEQNAAALYEPEPPDDFGDLPDDEAGRPIYVTLRCSGEQIDEREIVEVENIEEDEAGRDVLTFKCPKCGESHSSLRIG